MVRQIVVTEYDPEWVSMFEAEAELVWQILGKNCIAVHHIGSTSVPGLAAKPIIDILPVVYDIGQVDTVKADFEKIGYEYLGEFGIAGRRFLRKGGDQRSHHIHIFSEDHHGEIERHLAFRDYLRTHREVREEYARLKRMLAQKFPFDNEGYCDGKDEFVKKLEKEALDFFRG